MSNHKRALLSIVSLSLLTPTAEASESPEPRVDLAAFGDAVSDHGSRGIAWENPREVHEIRVHHATEPIADLPLRIHWWGSVWPAHGSGGWMKLDDPWNGRWVPVDAAPTVEEDGKALVFRFPPLTADEWPSAGDKAGSTYRRTLKVRVVREDEEPVPSGLSFAVFGSSTWREGDFVVAARLLEDGERTLRVSARNGVILEATSHSAPARTSVDGDRWTVSGVAGQFARFRVSLRYAESSDLNSNDLTRLGLRCGESPDSAGVSVVPQDVLQHGVVRLKDFGLLITPERSDLTFANDPGPPETAWRRSVLGRIAERDEMTREEAMEGIPRLSPPRWIPLGAPSARQEVFVGPDGNWSFLAMSIGSRFPEIYAAGRDSQRVPFRQHGNHPRADELVTRLDTSPDPTFEGEDRTNLERCLAEDWLPWVHVRWTTGPIRYEESLGTTILLGDYGDDVTRRGDETVVLLVELAMTNTDSEPQEASVSLRYSHNAPIRLQEDGVIAIEPVPEDLVPDGLHAVRGMLSVERPTAGGVEGWSVERSSDPESSSVLRWSPVLAAGETRTAYFKAPYVDLLDDDELARLRTLRYDEEREKVLAYWRARLARDMQIDVPDPALVSFYKANLWHNAITTDRDPQTGLYNQGVATVGYRVFANETVMVARSMDMRGEHLEAERYLEPMLHFQGREALTGRFSTKEGAFHSAGAYTHGQYAMNHGFVLWGAADHFLLTRDEDYLARVAPKLLEGCDFLIDERQATMSSENTPRSPIHGLAPASSLEDVIEFQYWFATNGYFHLGMKRVGEALAAAGHPEAERIRREAESYRRDIERAVREATTRAAAVRLRSGEFIPYVPSRVGQWRHLTEGWIREALYPALHLATTEVVRPEDPLMTWMLDDLEDSIYFSWQSGYNVSDYETTWFHKGGVTLQPCLLDTPPIYMARDEIPAALRSFWNTYALSIYPDVHCFAEWARRFGEGGGPVYKTSDESRFVMWLRQLLVWEHDEALWFGRGVPRAWLEDGKTVRIANAVTYHGTAGMTIESRVSSGRIDVTLFPPRRNLPKELWLHLRHPQGRVPDEVAVNGRPLSPQRIVGEDIRLTAGPDLPEADRLDITVGYISP